MDTLNKNEGLHDKVKPTSLSSIDMLINIEIRLTWLVLCLGRELNGYLLDHKKKKINFIKEATEYDREHRSY